MNMIELVWVFSPFCAAGTQNGFPRLWLHPPGEFGPRTAPATPRAHRQRRRRVPRRPGPRPALERRRPRHDGRPQAAGRQSAAAARRSVPRRPRAGLSGTPRSVVGGGPTPFPSFPGPWFLGPNFACGARAILLCAVPWWGVGGSHAFPWVGGG